MTHVAACGHSVPKVHENTDTDMVLERLTGPTMLDVPARRLWRVGSLGRPSGRLHEVIGAAPSTPLRKPCGLRCGEQVAPFARPRENRNQRGQNQAFTPRWAFTLRMRPHQAATSTPRGDIMRIPTTLAVLALASIGLIGTAGTAAADSDQDASVLPTLLCNKDTSVLALPLGKTACKVLTDAPASRKR
jgi:hypothetical protein